MKRVLFVLSLFFPRTEPFFIGRWSIPHYGGIIFTVDPTHLWTTMEDKGAVLRMRHILERKPETENFYCLDLSEIEIIRPPSDWYNIKKYRSSIGIFQKLKKEPIKVEIRVVDNDTLIASPFLLEDECFMLNRIGHK